MIHHAWLASSNCPLTKCLHVFVLYSDHWEKGRNIISQMFHNNSHCLDVHNDGDGGCTMGDDEDEIGTSRRYKTNCLLVGMLMDYANL